MARAALIVALSLAVAGCADDPRPAPNASDPEAAAVADLQEDFAELEDEVSELSSDRRALQTRLDRLSSRLGRALENLRSALAAAKGSAGAAADEAAGALARAEAVASDLRVLRERYDFHLRRYHGGG